MKIELKPIPIRELVAGYADNEEEGVVGYGGRLNIRPPYQREFVYKDKQRDAVIDTVTKGFPLNSIYWVDNGNNTFEVLDGQQRILSICQFCEGDFSLNKRYYENLTVSEQKRILDYNLMVYFCKGTDEDKLDWFRVINIAGVKLTEQELRNAVYYGPWVTAAKKYFSKSGCPAQTLAKDYLGGSANRQEYLETAIKWANDGDVEGYMADHQHDESAEPLWDYFESVIEWVENTFPKKRPQFMRGAPWGPLHAEHKSDKLDPAKLEKRVSELMSDDDVERKSGIYQYVLNGEEKHLSIRSFKPGQKQSAFERQAGNCAKCGKKFPIEEMDADHITPWSKGGKTIPENCQLLCRECNRRKSDF